jgi:hypothetical protein
MECIENAGKFWSMPVKNPVDNVNKRGVLPV